MDLLEGNALAPTSVPNMQQLLPLVLGQEMDRIIAADGGRPISTIFNGTTRLWVTVVRYLTDDWVIMQKSADLHFWPNP